MANAGSVIQTNQPNRYGPLPLQLWKATVTIPASATGVTVTSPNKLSGTVVAAWIDPATLTASATIKVYDSSNDTLTTHEYAVDYTVPSPAVETTAALSKRIRVNGQLSCVVASATAADSFVLYVWVDPNADTAVTLGAGTAAIGSVDVSDQISNLVPNSTQGDQRLTVDDTVGGVQLTALHADTTHVYVTLEDAQVRVTFDGSAPTSTNGHILNPYYAAYWPKARATAAKFIRTGATSGVIHCSQMAA